MEVAASQPVVSRSAGEGESFWWLGALATIKVATPAVTLIEVTDPPDGEAPLHVHHNEDEGFWVLDGDVTFEAGGEVVKAGPGDFLFGPRDVPHRYKDGTSGARMLFILTPGGFEGFIRATGEPARTRDLPPADVEPDMETVMANLDAHGAEILGE
jgi:quercetin dioxygenase-like cupin family protein